MGIREVSAIKTPDGRVYNLDDGRQRWLMSFSGFGMPTVVYKVERGYRQQGGVVTERDITDRIITLIYDVEGFNRLNYWQARARLLDILSWCLYEDLWLQHTDELGRLREIQARYTGGASFPALDPGSGNGTHRIADTLTFACACPFWLGDTHTITGALDVDEELAFPCEFPRWFGADFITSTSTIVYDFLGSWRTYPTIYITGPATGLYFANQTLGTFISYTFTIPAGVTVEITLSEIGATVTASNGAEYGNYLTHDSSPAQVFIGTPKDVTDGRNIISMQLSGATSESGLYFTYRDRYVGI